MNSLFDFSWLKLKFQELLQRLSEIHAALYVVIIYFTLAVIGMVWLLCRVRRPRRPPRFRDSEYGSSSRRPLSSTRVAQQLPAIDETPELVINPQTPIKTAKIQKSIEQRLTITENIPLTAVCSSTSHTPSADPVKTQQSTVAEIPQSSSSDQTTTTFSPRRSARLSSKTENEKEKQQTDSSQPASSRLLQEPACQPDTTTSPPASKKRESKRLLERQGSKDKDE